MDDWKSRPIIKSMPPHFAMVGNRQEPRKLQESPQGTGKRRQEGDSFQFTDMADGGYPNKIKRPCLEDVTLSVGAGTQPSLACAELQVPHLTVNPGPAAMGVAGPALLLENNPMNGSVVGSPFVVPSTVEMSLKGPAVPYYDKSNSVPAVDQELQELLDELTKIQEPSLNDLDLEKILGSKPEEPLVLDHPQATLGTTPKPLVQMPHLEGLGSGKEFASSCSQVTGVSLQIPPSSTGLSYGIPATSKKMASPSSSTVQAKTQGQALMPTTLPLPPVPQWHHAHQLKVLAASKQGLATKPPGPAPCWSGPPGLSPPYRPVPSPPHPPPPFSPQSLMVSCMSSGSLPGSTLQASPNAGLSGVAASGAVLGPVLPYGPEKLPSPALSQQPTFSPQSSILANLVSSAVKSPQGHLMAALPASNPGPSPPYRPEKLASPGLPQQSFTPQCALARSLTPATQPLGQPPQPSALFKPIPTSDPKALSMIMQQQGLASPSPRATEPFTFSNTKPLSHFISEPGPQKMPPLPAASRQPSLLHYLQQPTPTQASSATASSTAMATLQLPPPPPDHPSLLLQQMMQQPQRLQRAGASDSLPSLPRQQEKQRSGLTAMTPEQRSACIAQQMSQFQAIQEQVASKCSWTKASPPSSPPSSQNMMSPTRQQSQDGMGIISLAAGKQEGIVSSSAPFPLPSHQSAPGSLGTACQRLHILKAAHSGVPLPGFCPSPLSSQPLSPHQLRQPCVPRMPNMFRSAPWAVAAAASTALAGEPPPSQVGNSTQQHFDSNSIFTKALVRGPLVAPTLPSQQAVVSPHQVALGGRPGQKAYAALVSPSLLGHQGLRQSPVRGPVPVLSASKSLPQGMAGFGPVSPIQGIEPPSYVAAAAAAATASTLTASQSPGPFNRIGTPPELPQSDILPQPLPQLSDLGSAPDCSEVDFVEALLKSPSVSPAEGWVCDLRLIDDILEQHAAAHSATTQNTSRL
ncbi:mastermind-like domain-containing protein 1 isoform X5 [Manis pentadactyla]|uniref:mastermind-like domain-containing protein 1 isoform X5 n=1 Tax=Manis pentadactyla TaxID=143292 RepID=UPI00255C5A39|nr:mastermind-like domain-containing protein 1 isoform X5 [Manis pentadactyla]